MRTLKASLKILILYSTISVVCVCVCVCLISAHAPKHHHLPGLVGVVQSSHFAQNKVELKRTEASPDVWLQLRVRKKSISVGYAVLLARPPDPPLHLAARHAHAGLFCRPKKQDSISKLYLESDVSVGFQQSDVSLWTTFSNSPSFVLKSYIESSLTPSVSRNMFKRILQHTEQVEDYFGAAGLKVCPLQTFS